MFAVCHIKRYAEHGVAMTVPTPAHLFYFLSLSALRKVLVASFLPILISLSGSLLLPVWLSS